jgi:hypothetical protein
MDMRYLPCRFGHEKAEHAVQSATSHRIFLEIATPIQFRMEKNIKIIAAVVSFAAVDGLLIHRSRILGGFRPTSSAAESQISSQSTIAFACL